MNNPLSPDPRHALYPAPAGCSGYRLWKLLEARRPDLFRTDYIDAFDRRNLLPGQRWSALEARRLAANLQLDLAGSGATVVVFGAEVRRALGLPELLIHPQERGDVTWRQLPHPSGRNRWYNDPHNRLLAGLLLEELYEASTQEAEHARKTA